MTSTPSPQAALWDFDGTLVDTASVWWRAETGLVETLGGSGWTREMSASIHGVAMIEGARVCIEKAGKGGEVDPQWGVDFMERYVLDHLHKHGVDWKPGALDMVQAIQDAGVKQAVVSASSESILRAGMSQLPSIPFDTIVGGDHVVNGKPHPEPYLTAAQRLGVTASQCVAFEDSNEGRNSAEAAGCFVVAIAFHYPHDSAPGRMPVEGLEHLPWNGVVAEYGRWVASR